MFLSTLLLIASLVIQVCYSLNETIPIAEAEPHQACQSLKEVPHMTTYVPANGKPTSVVSVQRNIQSLNIFEVHKSGNPSPIRNYTADQLLKLDSVGYNPYGVHIPLKEVLTSESEWFAICADQLFVKNGVKTSCTYCTFAKANNCTAESSKEKSSTCGLYYSPVHILAPEIQTGNNWTSVTFTVDQLPVSEATVVLEAVESLDCIREKNSTFSQESTVYPNAFVTATLSDLRPKTAYDLSLQAYAKVPKLGQVYFYQPNTLTQVTLGSQSSCKAKLPSANPFNLVFGGNLPGGNDSDNLEESKPNGKIHPGGSLFQNVFENLQKGLGGK